MFFVLHFYFFAQANFNLIKVADPRQVTNSKFKLRHKASLYILLFEDFEERRRFCCDLFVVKETAERNVKFMLSKYLQTMNNRNNYCCKKLNRN